MTYNGIRVMKFVVASAAEAELAALFINAKEGKIIRLTLEEMGHKQPPTPIHCDNITATGIANDTVKKQQSRSMEMRFFWITDQVKIGNFDVQWHPGQENRADYYMKYFDRRHHQAVRPWYSHERNSPHILPYTTLFRSPVEQYGVTSNHLHQYIAITSPLQVSPTTLLRNSDQEAWK